MSDEKKVDLKVGTKSRTIQVDYLARVEGEGALYIKMDKEKVEEVRLKIFEPPRFFEALLRGRTYLDAPDITARICGICPVAYQMSSVYAMEDALGLEVPEYIHQLRRLLYCGEWIESHTLHIYMLHAPDFLGYPDAFHMDKEHLKRGLVIKKAGNEIIRLLGGREVHPINVKVGGFYTLPTKRDLLLLKEKLVSALEDVHKTIKWVNGFQFQDVTKEYECVALSHPAEYPMSRGVIASTSGLAVAPKAFDATFTEEQVPYSNALHTVMNNKGAYLVGPMARYNLNSKKLPKRVQEAISAIGFEPICTNTSRSIIVRALEVLFAFDEAIRIIDQYDQEKLAPSYAAKTCAATGFAATEAPPRASLPSLHTKCKRHY